MPAPLPADTPLIDRFVAATGGRRLVEGRPGMGWLTSEAIPAVIWIQITGALSMEVYYLVAFLTLLGAGATELAWLPMMFFSANVAQAWLVLRRPPRDPKRACVIDTLVGRALWLGTVLWPLLGWWLGWSSAVILAGVFASVFLGQLVHAAGGASFVTWTQAVVPRELRGRFYAWRHIGCYLVMAGLLWVVGLVFPRSADPGRAFSADQLPWLGALLGGATVVGIAGTYGLARSPAMPAAAQPRSFAPLWPQLRANPPFLRFTGYFLLTNLGIAASAVYQPLIYTHAGVDAGAYARAQALVYYPAMLGGILLAGWALPRIHGRPLLLAATLLLILGEGALLALTQARASWLLPLVLGTLGVAKGAWSIGWIGRLQDIIPPGDPRFVGVLTSVTGVIGLIGAVTTMRVMPRLEAAIAADPSLPTVAVVMVAVGVAFRVLSTPLLAWRDR